MEPHVRFEPNNTVRVTIASLSQAEVYFLLAAVLVGSCTGDNSSRRRAGEPDKSPSVANAAVGEAAPAPASSSPCVLTALASRYPAAERIIAIGDLHGDLAATRAALRLGGAIDGDDQWIGGALVVVQTGDILDRGDDEQAILDLFEELAGQAAVAGGAVHVLNGNHELMNVAADFRYVTGGGYADFEDVPGLDLTAPEVAAFLKPARARAAAFLPGGPYARLLAGHNTVVVVGDTVFVHGGVAPAYARRGLAAMNEGVRCWLMGSGPEPSMMHDPHGPLWTTMFSAGERCAELEQALAALEVERMVMGHEVQRAGVTSSCGGKAWRIDVGLAKLYGGPMQVVEITSSGVRVLSAE